MRFVLVCAHSHAVVVYLSMYRTCVYVNKHLCTVNNTQRSPVCVPSSTASLLRSTPTVLELLDHAVLHVAARWYHFGLVLQGPPPGGHQGHREE